MKAVTVLPYVVPSFLDACLERCRLDPVLLVDNTGTNRGVMRSHNLGVEFMRAEDADWLVVMSPAVRFADQGGRDFVAALEGFSDHAVVTAARVYGWHLIAFARETVEAAGYWDENFHPYGFDDNDYAIRVHKSRPGVPWGTADVEVFDTIMAHSVKLAGVRADAEAQLCYFEDKWGARPGPPFDAYHDHPWNEPRHSVRYWPAPRDLGLVDGASWSGPAPGLDECKVWTP